MTKARTVTHRAAKGLTTAFTTLFATVGLLLLTVALLARTDDRGITRVAGHPVMTVLSDSMTPTFRAGDLIVEDPMTTAADRLVVGDVVTFRTGDSGDLVTHRIVRVKGSPEVGNVSYRTQGDANNALDITPVDPERVVGLYIGRIPYGGYVLEAARSQTGMFLLLFIPGAALLLPVLARWWRSTGNNAPGEQSTKPPVERSELVSSGLRKGGGDY